MFSELWIFYLGAIASVFIADVSQIILKKAADKDYDAWYKSYLNPQVIFAYFLFVISTVCSVLSLKRLPLSLVPVWQSMGQILVAVLSFIFLKEKITKRKILGITIIVIGIVVFSL